MNKNWLVAGAVMGCLVGASIGACGQSGSGGTGGSSSAASSSGAGGASSSSSAASSGTGGASSSSSGAGGATSSSSSGGDAGACKTPSKLYPPPADAGTVTLYCPFSGADGGKDLYCDYATEHCCEPKQGQAFCDPGAMPCAAGDTDWKCEDPSQCPMGEVCCGTGVLMKSPDPMCANTASNFSGTHCAASCAPTEIVMCTSDAECGAGQTCLPFRARGNQVGACTN